MNDFLKSVRFKILAAILAVMVGFMVMSIYAGGTASFFSQIVSMVTTPVQRFTADMSDETTNFFNRFLMASQTYDRNARLQAELNELRGRLVDYDKIKHENDQLRQILSVKEKRPDITHEPASVISRNYTDRPNAFIIDKGSLDGVAYLNPVMTPDGLVGYVTEVSLTSSKVVTILDVSINVGAYSSATRDIGIVTGTVELASMGMCQIEYLPRDSQIAKGNLILTSGGEMFPKDLIIGTVEEVKTGSHGISIVATIKPASDIRGLQDVFVVTSFEGQGSKEEAKP